MDASWKTVVKGLKGALAPDRDKSITEALLEAAGAPLPVREARRRLFLLALAALEERPSLIAVEDDALVCLVSFSDLVEIVAGPPPTLGEVMDRGRAAGGSPRQRS